jgi:uncharacterized membrane protein (DUF2068 family)
VAAPIDVGHDQHHAETKMKRSPLVTLVIVLSALLGVFLAGTTVYLVVLTRSREILAEPDAADTIHGLLIGAGVLAAPAAITLIAVFGLWKGRFWGWLLSLVTDVGMLGVLVYSIIDDNEVDGELIALTAGFLVPVVLLLLPAVRKFFRKATPGLPVAVRSE